MSSHHQYEKLIPPLDLQSYVEYMWTFRGDVGTIIRQQIIAPSAHPSLIFCFGTPGVRIDTVTSKRYTNANIFCSIATRPFIVEQKGEAWYFGVELKPYGLTTLNGKLYPANSIGSLSEVFDEASLDNLLKSITTTQSASSTVQSIIAFLRAQINPGIFRDLARESFCTSLIKAVNGDIRVADSAQAASMSPSTLRRTFNRSIGISPEQFIGITRYNSFMQSLIQNPNESFGILAAMHGYYDEAHAVKDFKKYTGLSRKNFFDKHDAIAQMIHAK